MNYYDIETYDGEKTRLNLDDGSIMEETHTGSIYESAQECLEDNLPALSTETLIALREVIDGGGDDWLLGHLHELIEGRKNAVA